DGEPVALRVKADAPAFPGIDRDARDGMGPKEPRFFEPRFKFDRELSHEGHEVEHPPHAVAVGWKADGPSAAKTAGDLCERMALGHEKFQRRGSFLHA